MTPNTHAATLNFGIDVDYSETNVNARLSGAEQHAMRRERESQLHNCCMTIADTVSSIREIAEDTTLYRLYKISKSYFNVYGNFCQYRTRVCHWAHCICC